MTPEEKRLLKNEKQRARYIPAAPKEKQVKEKLSIFGIDKKIKLSGPEALRLAKQLEQKQIEETHQWVTLDDVKKSRVLRKIKRDGTN